MVAIANKTSWKTFQEKYLSKEDGYKYEWLNGLIIQTEYAINPKHLFILSNILNSFYSIKNTNGSVISGGNIFFDKNYRKLDIAYYTDQQILNASNGENIVPLFVIEIISTNDQMNYMHKKMNDYRAAEVAIVWHIFPKLQEVHVYQDKLNKMEVLKEKGICRAEPIIKGFKMSVNDIFKK